MSFNGTCWLASWVQ